MHWILSLFNRRGTQNILRMFGKKRNNRSMMWASILGVVISAASALLVRRNGNQTMKRPFDNLIETFQNQPTPNILKAVAATEFSKELLPDKNPLSDE